jgi:hypothetical protein
MNGNRSQASTGDLIKELAEEVKTLARQEVELAKAEVSEKGRRFGSGARALGVAAFLGFFAFAGLTATAILALSLAMPATAAAAIVTVAYGLLAGSSALVGMQRVRRAAPPVPAEAMESVKEDVGWMKTHLRSVKR